ncbi:DUF461 domain-containing protein [Streptomyces sp. CC53]|uniref:DUF461 domain-containing protein n=1 Tax=unclassified Streptomyces TaxID=2593676 RepID=UPI0008DC9DA5|nr:MULTISPECIES: DUF461 domain-containing protein [unclassified Streptomyces]OII63256.1 DUF461 domain-containing protein [Streptomyces sp. CC53]
MSRSLRRGALAATALVISLASLTACGAGNDAQTLGIRPDNAATSVGTIKVQNAVVITQPEAGAQGPSVVSATLFNDGDKAETLEAVTLPGTEATVKLTPAEGSGPVTIPAGGFLVLGGEGNAAAQIENGSEVTKDGDAQEVVFQLSRTGDVGLQAFVVPASGFYKDFGPSGAPSAAGTTSPSPATSPATSPSPDASTSPEGSPAATGSPAAGAEGEEHGDDHEH